MRSYGAVQTSGLAELSTSCSRPRLDMSIISWSDNGHRSQNTSAKMFRRKGVKARSSPGKARGCFLCPSRYRKKSQLLDIFQPLPYPHTFPSRQPPYHVPLISRHPWSPPQRQRSHYFKDQPKEPILRHTGAHTTIHPET